MRMWRVAAAGILAGCAVSGAWAQARRESSAAVVRRAEQLRAGHEDDAAAKLLGDYLSRHPQDVHALVALAKLRIEDGDTATATGLLARALDASPNSTPANITMGNLLLAEHREAEAMDRFETVLEIDLQNAAARSGELKAVTELALKERSAGHPEIALTALEHAKSQMPGDPQLLLELGIQATELGRLPEAMDTLEGARKLSPGNPEIVYAMARVELDEQHMAAAEKDLREYLAQRPKDASAHYGLGHVLAMDQKPDEARAEFERSIQLQPTQTESYYQLGQLALNAHDAAQAQSYFRKTLERDPKHGGALTGLGILAFRNKQYAQAEVYLAAAEKTSPDYEPAHYYRGLALRRLGRTQEARSELEKATELDRMQNGASAMAGSGAQGAGNHSQVNAPPF